MDFPVGKKRDKLKIPKVFYEKKFLKLITQGYFATDGSLVLTKNPNKFYPRLEIHSIAPKLLHQIQKHLIKEGLKGKFYKCKIKKKEIRWKNVHPQYRIQFNGSKNLLLFKQKVGFINPKQLEKFSNFLRYSKEYDKLIKGIPSEKQKLIRKKVKL